MLTILGLLGRYQRARVCPRDELVATDLAHLDFNYWHARWPRWVTLGQPMRWQPLESTFSDFERRFSGGSVPQVWASDSPVVDPSQASLHMLGLLPSAGSDEIENPGSRNT